jgi:formylglycine-generating enzyme required for sulfatase activity
MPKIFISYRRDDSEHVTGRIHDWLGPRFGRENVFLDVNTIPFGVDFREHLDRAVSKCDILLAVIGDGWLDIRFTEGARQGQRRLDDPGDFVRIEIESALTRGIPVIPLLVGRATMPGQQELPEGLRQLAFRNAAEVRSGRDFHDHVERLMRGIEYLVSLVGPVGGMPKGSHATSPLEEEQPKRPRPGDITTIPLGNGVEMKLAFIPPTGPDGFLMGSPESEAGRSDEVQHRVTLTKGYYLGIYQVTQAQWQAVTGTNPSKFKGDDLPVETVSFEECEQFCKKLGQKTGKKFRLPTESEWEYACRAGTTTAYHFGETFSTDQANSPGSLLGGIGRAFFTGSTTRVGKFPANAWGLYDMHGNVSEWCSDWYGPMDKSDKADPEGPQSGGARVLRGGSWDGLPRCCRAACRSRNDPALRGGYCGCRVLLCLD